MCRDQNGHMRYVHWDQSSSFRALYLSIVTQVGSFKRGFTDRCVWAGAPLMCRDPKGHMHYVHWDQSSSFRALYLSIVTLVGSFKQGFTDSCVCTGY